MPSAIMLWVWFCAYLNCAGWALSALRQLNAPGYAAALLLFAAGLFVWHKKTSAQIPPPVRWQKVSRRFRRPFPLAFLILSLMALMGGVLYAPTNYDALAYRIPRVLHWLAAGQWHWIHSIFDRINNRSCGIEWVSAPVIALLKTDRPLFLINFVSLLFLPGLVFSVFTRLSVRRRAAWHWMWLAPTGYGFLLQAGSIGNDLFGATFALAALDFALRAKTSRSPQDFFASILAAALMTSAKTGNLPLLLPWAIAILPSMSLIFRWPLKTFAVGALALFASALPTMVMNVKFSNDWSGAGLNRVEIKHALALRTGANIVLFTAENFVPPVFLMAEKYNRAVAENIPKKLHEQLGQLIEPPGARFQLDEMQIEENAGLGFGVSLLMLVSVVAAFFLRKKFQVVSSSWQTCVRWSPWLALLAVLLAANLFALARLLVPYYALLLPPLLAGGGHQSLVRKPWWRALACVVFLIAAMLLVVSPARPLFPVQTLVARLENHAPASKILARIQAVYGVYQTRPTAFAPVLAVLPPDLKVLGLTTFDDPETSLWRPFGARRIEHVCPDDTAMDLKARGVEYILVKEEVFGPWFAGTFEEWLGRMNAQAVQKISLELRASTGPGSWWLIKLN